MTGKMALISETDMLGNFADGELACGQKFLRFFHPASTTYWYGVRPVDSLNSLLK
jgi:hypothetical protein